MAKKEHLSVLAWPVWSVMFWMQMMNGIESMRHLVICQNNWRLPESMLFMDEYSLGMCLSWLHRTHSVSLLSGDNLLTFRPGNFFKHAIRLVTCRAARWEQRLTILLWTDCRPLCLLWLSLSCSHLAAVSSGLSWVSLLCYARLICSSRVSLWSGVSWVNLLCLARLSHMHTLRHTTWRCPPLHLYMSIARDKMQGAT